MKRYLTTDHPALSACAILALIGMAEFLADVASQVFG